MSDGKPWVVLLRDPRIKSGGFESWTEDMARGLRDRGTPVAVMVPGSSAAVTRVQERLHGARVFRIASSDSLDGQSTGVLAGLEAAAAQGLRGTFVAGGYRYINAAALNLGRSPFRVVHVLHGRQRSGVYGLTVEPLPAAVVALDDECGYEVAAALRSAVGPVRSLGLVHVIPNGVRAATDAEMKTKLCRPVATPLGVAAVARLDADCKRPMDYVRVVSEARRRGMPIALKIAGDGPQPERMERLVRDDDLGDSVSFLGDVPRATVRSLLLASDVALLTSELEAFPLAMLEAFGGGCPIITSDIPGAVRALVDQETGFRVAVGDIAGFVDHLAWFTANPSAVREMGKRGWERVSRQYTLDRTIEAYASLFDSVGRKTRVDREWRAPSSPILEPGGVQARGVFRTIGSRTKRLVRSFLS